MRVSRWVVVLAAVLAFTGCSSEPNSDTQIVVVNATGETIFRVFYSDCEDPQWGDDRLGDEEVIENAEERAFNVDPGCYDIRADFDVNGLDQVTLLNQQIDENTIFEWTPVH